MPALKHPACCPTITPPAQFFFFFRFELLPTPHYRRRYADNDLALGRIVEGLSHSRFWKETLILVIEDDSQLGMDHVDGHRTIAFCVSPATHAARGGGESRSLQSHLAAAHHGTGAGVARDESLRPHREADDGMLRRSNPDETPYTHVPNRVPLDELNPPLAALRGERNKWAQACARLDWSDVDRATPSIVARAVWEVQRPGEAFPQRWVCNLNVRDDE